MLHWKNDHFGLKKGKKHAHPKFLARHLCVNVISSEQDNRILSQVLL